MPDDAHWAQLLALSEHMLDAAKSSDWEALTDLEQQRQPVMQAYFTDVAPTLPPKLIADRIHVLQAVEQQILDHCMKARGEIAKSLKGFRRGKIAGQAYSEHAEAC